MIKLVNQKSDENSIFLRPPVDHQLRIQDKYQSLTSSPTPSITKPDTDKIIVILDRLLSDVDQFCLVKLVVD